MRMTKFFFLLLAGFFMISGMGSPLLAQDLYTIDNVPVGALGKSATEARTLAIEEGELKALTGLLQKLASSTAKPLPAITSDVLARAVQSVEVSNEKITSNRYQALLTVSFNPLVVRSVLTKANIAFSETTSSRILIIPVYKQKEEVLLWEPENKWRESMNAALRKTGNTQYILPLGDLDDIAALDKSTIDSTTSAKLAVLTGKYAADSVLIAVAQYDPASKVLHLSQSVYDTATAALPVTTSKDFLAQEEQALPALLDATALEIIPALKIAVAAESSAVAATLDATVPFNELKEWTSVRVALEKMTDIQKLSIKALAVGEAKITLLYLGTMAELSDSLAKNGLYLHKNGTKTIINRLQ
jgi:hypothetical protein